MSFQNNRRHMTPPHGENVNKSTCCRKNRNLNSRITNTVSTVAILGGAQKDSKVKIVFCLC